MSKIGGKDILEDVLSQITRNIVWSRSLDRPYQIWQQMAQFLYSIYEHNGLDDAALRRFRKFIAQARALPKANRDPDFRVLCQIAEALSLLLEELYGETGSFRAELRDAREENRRLREAIDLLKTEMYTEAEVREILMGEDA